MAEKSSALGLAKNEEIKFFVRKHWLRFFRIIFFGLAVGLFIFVALVAFGGFFERIQFEFIRAFYVFFVMVISIIFLNIFFLQIINYFFDMLIVTENRILIVKKTIFLRNDNNAVDLTKIQDFSVESRGLFCNYLGYGELVIILSTSAPPIRIRYIPKPHQKLEFCNRVKREYIWRRHENRKEPSATAYLQDIKAL